jgi:hypothetical protein
MPAKCARLLLQVALILVSLGAASAQDPIVGTWNLKGANSDGTFPFIAVMSFNAGGTAVEFDSAGTNSSASPGESITLGKWLKTADLAYRYKVENYIYDSAGNLSDIAIATCNVTLASTLHSFGGNCSLNFFTCSVSSCPGTLVVGPVSLNVKGRRF